MDEDIITQNPSQLLQGVLLFDAERAANIVRRSLYQLLNLALVTFQNGGRGVLQKP